MKEITHDRRLDLADSQEAPAPYSIDKTIASLLSSECLPYENLFSEPHYRQLGQAAQRLDLLLEKVLDSNTSSATMEVSKKLLLLHRAALELYQLTAEHHGHMYQEPISYAKHLETEKILSEQLQLLEASVRCIAHTLENSCHIYDEELVAHYLHNMKKLPDLVETELREGGPLVKIDADYQAKPGDILISRDSTWHIVTSRNDHDGTRAVLKTNEARVLQSATLHDEDTEYYLVRSLSHHADLALLSFDETPIDEKDIPPDVLPLGRVDFKAPCVLSMHEGEPRYFIQRGNQWFETNSLAVQQADSRNGESALFAGLRNRPITHIARPLYQSYTTKEELVLGVIKAHDSLAEKLLPQRTLEPTHSHRGQEELSKDLDYFSEVLQHTVFQLMPATNESYETLSPLIREIQEKANILFQRYASIAKFIPSNLHLDIDELPHKRKYPSPDERKPAEVLTIVHKHMLHPRIVNAHKTIRPEHEEAIKKPYITLMHAYNDFTHSLNSLLYRLDYQNQREPVGLSCKQMQHLDKDSKELLSSLGANPESVSALLSNGAKLLVLQSPEGGSRGYCVYSSPERLHRSDAEIFTSLSYKERIGMIHELSVPEDPGLEESLREAVAIQLATADFLIVPQNQQLMVLPLAPDLKETITKSVPLDSLQKKTETPFDTAISTFEQQLGRYAHAAAEDIILNKNGKAAGNSSIERLIEARRSLQRSCMQARILLRDESLPDFIKDHATQYFSESWVPEKDYGYELEQEYPLLKVFADIHYERMVIEGFYDDTLSLGADATPYQRTDKIRTVDATVLTKEERKQLCVSLSELTERNPYRSGDPRTQDFGASVTYQPPALFESILEQGARLRLCVNEQEELLGYVLFLPPSQTRSFAPEVAERYQRFGESGYIYFVVSDPEIGSAPVYSLLINAVTFDLPESDLSVGRVLEDNYRGMLIHSTMGGGALIAGDQKQIKTNLPYTGKQEFELIPSSTAIGMILPANPELRKRCQSEKLSTKEALHQSRDILHRELPGIAPNTWEEQIKTWRKRVVLDTYIQDLNGRQKLFDAIAEEHNTPEQLVDAIQSRWGPHWRNILKLSLERTLPAYQVDAIQHEKFWDGLLDSNEDANFLKSLPEYARKGIYKPANYSREQFAFIYYEIQTIRPFAQESLGTERASLLKLYLLKTPLNDPIVGFQTS